MTPGRLAATVAALALLSGCTGPDAHPADPAPQPDRAAHSRTTDRAA
jgi:hypothetical protein